MDTQSIETRNQATATATASKSKTSAAAEGFGAVLTKLFDRLAASSSQPSEGDGALDDTLTQAQARSAKNAAKPDRPEPIDRDPPDRSREEDADSDDDRDLAAAMVEPPPQRLAPEKSGKNGVGDGTSPEADGGKVMPPTAKPANMSAEPQAELAAGKKLPSTAKPAAPSQNAPQPNGGTDQAAGSQAQNPIKVTVTEAPVRAQADQPLTPGAALAAQADSDAAGESDVKLPGVAGNSAAGNAQNAGAQNAATGGSGSQTNQGQAGATLGAMADASGATAAEATTTMPASFAAQLEASAGAGSRPAEEGAHQIFAVGPASTPGTANAVRNTANTPALPQLPRMSALDQIAVNIKKAIAAGKDEITINLKPAELGRIEVKLEVGKDGQVSAQVRADRPETLELLQRDSRGLERALQDAGLTTDSGALSFGLRGENRPDGQAQGGGHSAGGAAAAFDRTADDTNSALPASARTRAGDGHIDLHV